MRDLGAVHAHRQPLLQLLVLMWQLREMLEREWGGEGRPCLGRAQAQRGCKPAGCRAAGRGAPKGGHCCGCGDAVQHSHWGVSTKRCMHAHTYIHTHACDTHAYTHTVATLGVAAAAKEWGTAQKETSKRLAEMRGTLEDHDPASTDPAGELACMLAAGGRRGRALPSLAQF